MVGEGARIAGRPGARTRILSDDEGRSDVRGSLMVAAESDAFDLRRGELIGGKYELRRRVGVGAMGAVYEARHIRTGKRVAVKVLVPEMASNPEAGDRFFREARAAGAIEHPSVVDIYDVDLDGGTPFIVMELLRGETLADFMERRGALAVDEALHVTIPAMEGVHAAHRDGIIHRDLKPENIFLCRDRNGRFVRSKVLDFGISKMSMPADASRLRMTAEGTLMGTPLYMAPEQLESATAVDARTDVYAMGCVFFEALTGRPPFDSQNVAEIFVMIATREPPHPSEVESEVPRAVGDVVRRALSKDPADRFDSMRELARALLLAREGNYHAAAPSPEAMADTVVATGGKGKWSDTVPDERPSAGEPDDETIVVGRLSMLDETDEHHAFSDEDETNLFDRGLVSEAEGLALAASEAKEAADSADAADAEDPGFAKLKSRFQSMRAEALDDPTAPAEAWGYGDEETGSFDVERGGPSGSEAPATSASAVGAQGRGRAAGRPGGMAAEAGSAAKVGWAAQREAA